VPPSDAPLTEGEFSTIAVDKTVDKHVRIARERCYACVATLRLQKRHCLPRWQAARSVPSGVQPTSLRLPVCMKGFL
jgi:hypothetical protein